MVAGGASVRRVRDTSLKERCSIRHLNPKKEPFLWGSGGFFQAKGRARASDDRLEAAQGAPGAEGGPLESGGEGGPELGALRTPSGAEISLTVLWEAPGGSGTG